MFLLDTNVVSELRKVDAGKADLRVAAWQQQVALAVCFISVITLMELEIGVLRLQRRDAKQGALLRTWLDTRVEPAFAGRVLALDADVARCCACLHVPNPRSERDALIAATAVVHGITVVTRNTQDFAGLGVPLLDPWRSASVQEPRTRYLSKPAKQRKPRA